MPGLQKTNCNSFILNERKDTCNDESANAMDKTVLPKFFNEQGLHIYMNLIIENI